MDKVHTATRPAWALRKLEVLISLGLAILLSTAATTFFSGWIRAKLAPHLASHEISESMATFIIDASITITLTFLGVLIIPVYKKFKTLRYPGTYLYCFEKMDRTKDNSGTRGNKVFVVGGLKLEALDNGGIQAKGIAYDWAHKAIIPNSEMRWTSRHVGTT